MELLPFSVLTDQELPNELISLLSDSGHSHTQLTDLRRSYVVPPLTSYVRIPPSDVDNAKIISDLQAAVGGPDFHCSPHKTLPNVIVIRRVPPINENSIDVDKPSNITSDKIILIDAICASNVLRGAVLFSPGVLTTSDSICPGDTVHLHVLLTGTITVGM